MGAYINPKSQSKEDWLRENAKPVTVEYARTHTDFSENLLIALVDNGPFKAAGIAFDEREKNDWLNEVDTTSRPIRFYTAPKAKILEDSNLKTYL